MKKLIKPYLFIVLILVLASCSSTKNLKPGQALYTGAEVNVNPDSTKKIDNNKEIKAILKSKTRPEPNKSFLGFRYKLFVYNLAGEPTKPKGFRSWLRRKGEAPVLLSQVKLKYNTDVLTSYLISQGYLQAVVTGDTVSKNKKGKAIYTANTGIRYKINKVSFPADSSGIAKVISDNKNKTLLKTGNFYDLDVYKNERVRIDNDLKENGYFYFNPDYLILQVDSTVGKNLVDIRVRVKDIAPDMSLKPYTINEINIFPNYSIRRDSALRLLKPLVYKDFNIYDNKNTFKPRLFDRLVFFQKGEPYNRKDHNQSLNRMVNIGVFQDVKAEFLPLDSFKNNQLNLNIYLTPLKKNSLTLSVVGTSKSNNFIGSELKITNTTRNLFRGAEQLDISASGGFESQIGGVNQHLNTFSFTTEAKLSIPRFIVPFYKPNSTTAFIPRTITSLSYQMLSRGNIYKLSSFSGDFGYNWKENQYKEHNFKPINISYIRTSKGDSARLDSLFKITPGLQKSLEPQFIIGSTYNFTYSNQTETQRRNNLYFYGSLETGGNVWGSFIKKNEEGNKNIFGVPLSQFIRVELDGRNYFKITPNLIWANRLNIGYGYAYGNSTSLPFVRQFFAGGTNDIRAFSSRSLGPGTYHAVASSNGIIADQAGDIKLMLNTELRFKIISIFQGALFADAGNIWLRKEDLGVPGTSNTGRPGSGFKFKNALSELAVGTGAGIRVDAKIIVVRLDVAFPIRKPYLAPNERWVIDQVDFGNKDWRKENLIYNIGIGYPF